MSHFIVATHGYFAKGIMDAVRMICGEQKNFTTFCAYTENENGELEIQVTEKIKDLLDSYPEEEDVIVLVDLLGGSVCNEFIKQIDRRPFHLISGVNLGLILEFIYAPDKLNKDMIETMIERSRSSIMYINKLVDEERKKADNVNDWKGV